MDHSSRRRADGRQHFHGHRNKRVYAPEAREEIRKTHNVLPDPQSPTASTSNSTLTDIMDGTESFMSGHEDGELGELETAEAEYHFTVPKPYVS